MAIVEMIQANPRISITIISLLVAAFINIVNYFVLDKEEIKSLKEKQKNLQNELKKNKDNPTKMMEIQKEMFTQMGEQMKHSFRPMMITFIPIIIIFSLIRGVYAETVLAKSWFWWYFAASIVFSSLMRKILKLP